MIRCFEGKCRYNSWNTICRNWQHAKGTTLDKQHIINWKATKINMQPTLEDKLRHSISDFCCLHGLDRICEAAYSADLYLCMNGWMYTKHLRMTSVHSFQLCAVRFNLPSFQMPRTSGQLPITTTLTTAIFFGILIHTSNIKTDYRQTWAVQPVEPDRSTPKSQSRLSTSMLLKSVSPTPTTMIENGLWWYIGGLSWGIVQTNGLQFEGMSVHEREVIEVTGMYKSSR